MFELRTKKRRRQVQCFLQTVTEYLCAPFVMIELMIRYHGLGVLGFQYGCVCVCVYHLGGERALSEPDG